MSGTVSFQVVGDVIVVVHGPRMPTNTEFDAYIAFCGQHSECFRYAIFTPGTAPDAAQRQKMANHLQHATGGQPPRVAVVSDGILVRGVVTAISWLNAGVRGFARRQVPEAFKYLEVGEKVGEEILKEVRFMRLDVGWDD